MDREGDGWLGQAEGVGFGVFGAVQGWAPKWSEAEIPQGVEFGVERASDVKLGPEDAGEGAYGGELTAWSRVGLDTGT